MIDYYRDYYIRVCRRDERDSLGIVTSKKIRFYKAVQNVPILFLCAFVY